MAGSKSVWNHVKHCFLLAHSLTFTYALNLSPIESFVISSRLQEIQDAVELKYSSRIPVDEVETIIFPGAGGIDELVLELEAKTPRSFVVDWKEHRGTILTAAFDGEAVGQAIARIVGERKYVRYIGISVGAFCANAAAATTMDDLNGKTNVELMLLDPFCGRGVFGPSYGKEYFGRKATTAIQILNTDDPVPTTNDPLPHCFCLDVTGAPERKAFVPPKGDSMHSWPVAYLARHYDEEIARNASYQRGKVVQL